MLELIRRVVAITIRRKVARTIAATIMVRASIIVAETSPSIVIVAAIVLPR